MSTPVKRLVTATTTVLLFFALSLQAAFADFSATPTTPTNQTLQTVPHNTPGMARVLFASPNGTGTGLTANSPASLFQAVAQANAGDTISLATGNYYIVGEQNDPLNLPVTGALIINKDLVIDGVAGTTLSCSGSFNAGSCISFETPAGATQGKILMRGLTVNNTFSTNGTPAYASCGNPVYVSALRVDLTLKNVTFDGGYQIDCQGTNMGSVDVYVYNDTHQGGNYVPTQLTVNNSSFNDFYYGIVSMSKTLNITNSSFNGNALVTDFAIMPQAIAMNGVLPVSALIQNNTFDNGQIYARGDRNALLTRTKSDIKISQNEFTHSPIILEGIFGETIFTRNEMDESSFFLAGGDDLEYSVTNNLAFNSVIGVETDGGPNKMLEVQHNTVVLTTIDLPEHMNNLGYFLSFPNVGAPYNMPVPTYSGIYVNGQQALVLNNVVANYRSLALDSSFIFGPEVVAQKNIGWGLTHVGYFFGGILPQAAQPGENIAVDPQFADPYQKDFSVPVRTSALVNASYAQSVKTDVFGTKRPNTISLQDIGAIEY